MDKTSPREVLLHYGKWIGATEFAKLISEKKQVTERQAKTLISEAYNKNEVKKHIFPDRRVWYGLPEFGPPTSVNLSQVSSFSVNGWNPPPDFAFSPKFEEAYRRNREAHEVDDDPAYFPRVPFNWHNWSRYQLRVRLEVQVFLGGKNIGLINDLNGYYNGKASIPVEPYVGRLRDGCFTLPNECAKSTKRTTIEAKARILDQNDASKKEHIIIKSWTYDPIKKDWFYEPKSFSEEALNRTESVSSWDSLKDDFRDVGAHLVEIQIVKYDLGDPGYKNSRSKENFANQTIKGIIMLKGALSMQTMVKINIPEKYDAFLFTESSLDKYDTLTWQGTNYIVREIEDIYDVYSLSYRIAKLVKQPPYVEPAFVLF